MKRCLATCCSFNFLCNILSSNISCNTFSQKNKSHSIVIMLAPLHNGQGMFIHLQDSMLVFLTWSFSSFWWGVKGLIDDSTAANEAPLAAGKSGFWNLLYMHVNSTCSLYRKIDSLAETASSNISDSQGTVRYLELGVIEGFHTAPKKKQTLSGRNIFSLESLTLTPSNNDK